MGLGKVNSTAGKGESLVSGSEKLPIERTEKESAVQNPRARNDDDRLPPVYWAQFSQAVFAWAIIGSSALSRELKHEREVAPWRYSSLGTPQSKASASACPMRHGLVFCSRQSSSSSKSNHCSPFVPENVQFSDYFRDIEHFDPKLLYDASSIVFEESRSHLVAQQERISGIAGNRPAPGLRPTQDRGSHGTLARQREQRSEIALRGRSHCGRAAHGSRRGSARALSRGERDHPGRGPLVPVRSHLLREAQRPAEGARRSAHRTPDRAAAGCGHHRHHRGRRLQEGVLLLSRGQVRCLHRCESRLRLAQQQFLHQARGRSPRQHLYLLLGRLLHGEPLRALRVEGLLRRGIRRRPHT